MDTAFSVPAPLWGCWQGTASRPGCFFSGLLLFGGVWDIVMGETEAVPVNLPGVKVITNSGILRLTTAGFLLVLIVLGVIAVGVAERRLADHFLGPGGQELMRRRIAELTATRSGIVRAVDDERRRIERDLHDGVQQRGVALARRVLALDGVFTVDSPPGGPTKIATTLPKDAPCG
ncbi:hypothetical protein GCM10023075_69460 [Streptosporangium album]